MVGSAFTPGSEGFFSTGATGATRTPTGLITDNDPLYKQQLNKTDNLKDLTAAMTNRFDLGQTEMEIRMTNRRNYLLEKLLFLLVVLLIVERVSFPLEETLESTPQKKRKDQHIKRCKGDNTLQKLTYQELRKEFRDPRLNKLPAGGATLGEGAAGTDTDGFFSSGGNNK